MIEVKHLTKKYGLNEAVSDLTFTVENGRITGFLGPNGAGKSTTMNIITGCLSATGGEVLINGCDIFEEAAKAKSYIGYLPEQPPLYMDMTPREYLHFVASAKGVAKAEEQQQLADIMKRTGIEQVADRIIKTLSKGYKQRVGIAQALVGNPDIIILDEPTVGLDPKQIIEIRELIRSLGKDHTVILSSHILSEIQAVCDHVIIISKGKLVASDTPEHLENLFAGKSTMKLRVKATEKEVQQALASVENVSKVVYKPADSETAEVLVEFEGNKDMSEAVFFGFCDVKRPILRMNTARVSLEDVFIQLTSEGHPVQQPADAQTEQENQGEEEEKAE